ncbi:MAG: efflux RND transporter permease subunit [Lentisphaerota bacterium]
MNIAEWCIKNNRTAIVAFVLIAWAGVYTFLTISRLENPDFPIRVAVVTSFFPGAAPQKVEELVTEKIEKKVQEMSEVKGVYSESLTGVSMIMVEIHPKFKDLQPIWTRLRNKIDDIRSSMPEGVYGPYVNDEFGDVFPVVISLTGDGFSYRELKDIADNARDELLKARDVAKVDLYGTQEERIFIEFSNARLADLGYTPMQLADLLKTQNVLQPGGNALVGPERVTIEATGEFKSLEQIKQVSLRVPGRSETLYLEDIATVRRDFIDPPGTFARFNGQPAIMISVSMAEGGKVTDMGEAVLAAMNDFESRQPVGIDMDAFLYQPKYVERSINDLMSNLKESFFYVFVVMLCFCGLRMGIITGLLVPMAMLMAIMFMPFFGIKLHAVSIASLIIALGMLVDNGIVTSENILVRMAGGQDRLTACKEAVLELWVPLLTSSLTTIVAFLPIAMAKSDVGEYCLSLFQVVSLTLLSSWILAITLIPMLCYYFLKPKPQSQFYANAFYTGYRKCLILSLKHRLLFVVLMLVLMAASLWGFGFVPSIFFPPNEREMMLVDFWQPYGTDIRVTRDRAAELEKFLLADTNVVSTGTFVGEGGPRWYLSLNVEQQNANYANLIVNTRTPGDVKGLMERTRRFLSGHFPDGRFTVKELENGPPVGAPIQIRLSGPDIDTIYALRDQIGKTMAAVPGISNIRDDWGEWTKKMVVEVNQEKARKSGFTSQDVASSLQSQISGLQATEYREGKEIIPIELRSKESYREDLGKLESLNVYSYNTSRKAPLLQMASTRLTWQPSDIRRRDKMRTMTIMADVEGGFASEVLSKMEPKVDALTQGKDWPAGYSIEYAGEMKESGDAQNSIMEGLPLAVGLLVLILIWQFNSIRRPLIIALTIPPMMVGITLGLLVTHAPFGFMAFLGFISLMGVIVNNAIMMIDRMEIERAAGQTIQDAIIVSAQRRLRPILATATTTIVGLVPLSLNGGEMWRPMANTIMFGLGFATILTLALCPVLYALFFGAHFKGYTWNPDVLKKTQE